jgi:hypothetical protein
VRCASEAASLTSVPYVLPLQVSITLTLSEGRETERDEERAGVSVSICVLSHFLQSLPGGAKIVITLFTLMAQLRTSWAGVKQNE